MTPSIIPGPSYRCADCGEQYEGEPLAERAFDADDLDTGDYYTYSEAWSASPYWKYSCPTGHSYYLADGDLWEFYFGKTEGDVYRCSECGTCWMDMAHGLACCGSKKKQQPQESEVF